eukprot:GHVQ01041168.1.p1 GENE.GHVQ01041168.1~~GHVQ01041168.1.p1  ORF type:complete len:126 (-),score=44.52 GHVQ01041168.1:95-472(-)
MDGGGWGSGGGRRASKQTAETCFLGGRGVCAVAVLVVFTAQQLCFIDVFVDVFMCVCLCGCFCESVRVRVMLHLIIHLEPLTPPSIYLTYLPTHTHTQNTYTHTHTEHTHTHTHRTHTHRTHTED